MQLRVLRQPQIGGTPCKNVNELKLKRDYMKWVFIVMSVLVWQYLKSQVFIIIMF